MSTKPNHRSLSGIFKPAQVSTVEDKHVIQEISATTSDIGLPRQLGARASYSHRGRYQTLDRIAEYNENGLWSFRGVRFSRPGTLLQTMLYLVKHSMQGYFASEMRARGVNLCPNTAGKLLKERKYSLRVNRKSIAETQHRGRNPQFELIADFRKRFEDSGNPILSMDTKKKELVGIFRNQGQAWRKKPELVNQHDFRSHASAITSPYGLYEPVRKRGTIVIGTSSDTPEFAVDCLDTWISIFGWPTCPSMKEILLLCDSGGSNGKDRIMRRKWPEPCADRCPARSIFG